MSCDVFEYGATILRVVDADTVHLDVDLGFEVRRRDAFRLAGLNAPEMSTPEGKIAKAWLERLLPPGTVITVRTIKDRREKFGRYLAILLLPDGTNLNEALVASGHAVPYLPR